MWLFGYPGSTGKRDIVALIATGTAKPPFWSPLNFVMAYGIYRKSRIAATAMFVYFILSKIWLLMETGQAGSLIIGVIFLYYFYQAMMAIFQYHKLIRSPQEPDPLDKPR